MRRDILWLALGLVAFGGLIELLQGWMSLGREADIKDLVADALGIATGLLLAVSPLGRLRALAGKEAPRSPRVSEPLRPLADRMRPQSIDEIRRPAPSAGAGPGAARGAGARSAAFNDPLGPARAPARPRWRDCSRAPWTRSSSRCQP